MAVLSKKVRCLDFEIYDIKDEPVIATSDSNSFNYKGSYNYLTVEDIFKNVISELAFKKDAVGDFKGLDGCETDPLFLNLRIKTKHIPVIDRLGKYIVKFLGNYLLGPDFNYTSSKGQEFGTKVLMNDLRGEKIVIMVVMEDGLIENCKEFAQVVNVYSTYNTSLATAAGQIGSPDYIALRSNQVDKNSFGTATSGAGGLLTSYTLVMVMPKLSYECRTFDTFGYVKDGAVRNPDFNKGLAGGFGAAGVQFIAPCFQSGGGDGDLYRYLTFFNANKASIVKKHDDLCQVDIMYDKAREIKRNQTLNKARPIGGEGGKLFHSLTGVTGL